MKTLAILTCLMALVCLGCDAIEDLTTKDVIGNGDEGEGTGENGGEGDTGTESSPEMGTDMSTDSGMELPDTESSPEMGTDWGMELPDTESSADMDTETGTDWGMELPDTASDVPTGTDISTDSGEELPDTESDFTPEVGLDACGVTIAIGSFGQAWDGGAAEECCSTVQEKECWLLDAEEDSITCSPENLENCAAGQTCSAEGVCTCSNSCDCNSGVCTEEGVCAPSICDGFHVCSCWGGCVWWDSADPTNTPANDALSIGFECCENSSNKSVTLASQCNY